MTFKHLSQTPLWIRMLAGLAFGILAGSVIWDRGLGLTFLAALSGAAALLSLGLGTSRFLVGIAIWLGQYSAFYWRFMEPVSPTVETAALLFITRNFFVFMPAMAIVVGAYAGLLVERVYRTPEKNSRR